MINTKTAPNLPNFLPSIINLILCCDVEVSIVGVVL